MKKLMACLLSLILVFFAIGCSDTAADENTSTQKGTLLLLDGNVKKRRSEEMLMVTAESSKQFMERMQKRQVKVLLEEKEQITGCWIGYTPNYMKVAVAVPDENLQLQGREVNVVIDGYENIRSANHDAAGLEKILKGVLQ